jgi:primosomal protein N' (replication factor Y)
MALEIKKGYKIISKELLDRLNDVLSKGEQAIILLNRRGYSTTVSCHSCGYKVVCPNCDIPLTYHKKTNTMKCHYCNYTTYKPDTCPECKSHDINCLGLGTEKLEEEIKRLIPTSKVIRMDVDTTSTKGSHKRIFEAFKNHEYDILVGTQMISKGLDFANVTLVGVVNGDASLNIPDFRSSERTFSLLNQVAGRAGRGDKKGSVIIQGFNLNHYSIEKASVHDYVGFYEEEMKVRKVLKYPPYYNLSMITISGTDLNLVMSESDKIATYLRKNIIDAIILGPSSSIMPKINNKYYYQITIKYKKSEKLIKALELIIQKYNTNKNIRIDVDLNTI